jgi:hypothetical protein
MRKRGRQEATHKGRKLGIRTFALNANCQGVVAQNCDVRRMLRRFSAAVATSREGQRLLRPDRADRLRRWGLEARRCAEGSGDFLPPSPPSEKATARQDQARQASTRDGAGDGSSAEGWIA